MLDNLVRTVEKLRERVRQHRDSIGRFEIRTRASLIDPMLHALGWDVGDPAQVTPELAVKAAESGNEGRPDYALLGAHGKAVLFIEAKKLAVTRAPIQQLVAYVTTANIGRPYKVSFCAWTNGDIWKVIDIPAQKEVLDVQISRDDPAECAFKLLGLWRTSLVDGSLRTPVKLPARTPIASHTNLDPQTKMTPKHERADDGQSRTLASFDATTEKWRQTSIIFPGEAPLPLHRQKDLIVSVANYLVRTEGLTADNGTLRSGGTRYIVHSSPIHSNNEPFKAGVMLDNGLHLETSNPLPQTVQYALKLLDHYGTSGLADRVLLTR